MLPNHEYCRDAVLALVQLPGLDSRSRSDRLARVLARHFRDVQHMEDQYLAFRLRRTPLASLAEASRAPLVRPLARYIVRRNLGLIFTATKPLEN